MGLTKSAYPSGTARHRWSQSERETNWLAFWDDVKHTTDTHNEKNQSTAFDVIDVRRRWWWRQGKCLFVVVHMKYASPGVLLYPIIYIPSELYMLTVYTLTAAQKHRQNLYAITFWFPVSMVCVMVMVQSNKHTHRATEVYVKWGYLITRNCKRTFDW